MDLEIKSVRINAGKGYDVSIGENLLGSCGDVIGKTINPCRAAIITDSNVERLFLSTVADSLENEGFSVSTFSFPAGEQSKSIGTLSNILEFLGESRLTRTDCVLALGGGVTGDLAGFAAGTYLRGIRYVQIPTTFLAAVDSSVGGKTGINLMTGKNLAGVFVQPEAVICDVSCVKQLPDEVFADGAAEAIKTGILSGEDLFSLFETGDVKPSLAEIIKMCVTFKGSIVEADEFEAGLRKTLNLGHTVGHAIEKCSNYAISHGHAVAAGMAVIARAADRLGFSSTPVAPRIEKTLIRNSLPIYTDFSAENLTAAALSDKKRSGEEITLVIPDSIGRCYLKKIPVSTLHSVINAGLEVSSWTS
ncbi:MAG: 3-dehydroquinate synthase [Clostridiales bacterium]|nr:3-dehydroquinate synthase [Clostridiales bacterium]